MSTRKILHKRGMRAQIPRLDEAEIAFTTDDKRLHIGTKDGNLQLMDEKDKREISAQLAEKAGKTELETNYAKKTDVNNLASGKADKSYVDTQISNIGNASPKGTYATLTALQTAFPTGTTGIYVVTADGKWYYWNGTAWTAGGTYQSTGVAEKSIKPTNTDFMNRKSANLLKFENIPETTINGITYSLVNGEIKFNGTATANITINFKLLASVLAGSYYFSMFSSGHAGQNYSLYFTGASGAVSDFLTLGSMNKTMSLSADSTQIQIYIRTGQVFTNYVGKFQISTNVVTEYSKYDIYELSPEIIISRNSLPADIGNSTNPVLYKGREVTVFNNGIAVGDSLTEGTFNHGANNNSFVSIKNYAYPAHFKKVSGVNLHNSGVGGKTMAQWYEAYKEASLLGFDFAVIELGVNDGLQGVAPADSKTALQNIVTLLKNKNKGIKIFISTITPAYADGVTTYDRTNTIIKEVATTTSNCYLLDMTRYSECRKGTVYENGHLTALGYAKKAQEYVNYISYIIANNINDFKYVQFIGTDYTVQ